MFSNKKALFFSKQSMKFKNPQQQKALFLSSATVHTLVWHPLSMEDMHCKQTTNGRHAPETDHLIQ